MTKGRKTFCAVLVLVAALAAAGAIPVFFPNSQDYTQNISINGVELKAEIVDTRQALKKGLSGREDWGDIEAMVFAFGRDDTHGIWMKDMNFPIDILWLSEKQGEAAGVRVFYAVSVRHSVSPDTFPSIFYPTEEARVVIELPAGFLEKHDIKAGDSVSIRGIE